MKKDILALSNISDRAQMALGDKYNVTYEATSPEAILVRAFEMKEYAMPSTVKCVARAGAGVNNIPLDKYAEMGIPVFNTPGANSNAVKELTILALLMCCRDVYNGIVWANKLTDGETTVEKQVEKGKSKFVGCEIDGKTLGIIGLGVIGKKVGLAAQALGMNVVFVDPYYNGEVPQGFKKVETNDEVYAVADFITIHVPLMDATRGFINAETIAKMKDSVNILNIARGELVNNDDMIDALASKKVHRYVVDFPTAKLLNNPDIVVIPHLGASTFEAEENCAEMAGEEIREYLEKGNLVNCVNYPNIRLEGEGHSVTLLVKGEICECELKALNPTAVKIAVGKKGYSVAKLYLAVTPREEMFDKVPNLVKAVIL